MRARNKENDPSLLYRSVLDYDTEDELSLALMTSIGLTDDSNNKNSNDKCPYDYTLPPSVDVDGDDVSAAIANTTNNATMDWVLGPLIDYNTTEVQSMKEELKRLQVLKSYQLLEYEGNEFQHITNIAARKFQVPICSISVQDLGRCYVVAGSGLPLIPEVRNSPRNITFCSHTIQFKPIPDTNPKQYPVHVIHDATKDFRFCNNPIVTGPPFVKFYASAPLVTPEGYKIGTICLIDWNSKSKEFDINDQDLLTDLAGMTMDYMIERRKKLQSIEHTKRISQYIATTSHQLITPLSGIHLNLSLLEDDDDNENTTGNDNNLSLLKKQLGTERYELLRSATHCSDVMLRMCQTSIDSVRSQFVTFSRSSSKNKKRVVSPSVPVGNTRTDINHSYHENENANSNSNHSDTISKKKQKVLTSVPVGNISNDNDIDNDSHSDQHIQAILKSLENEDITTKNNKKKVKTMQMNDFLRTLQMLIRSTISATSTNNSPPNNVTLRVDKITVPQQIVINTANNNTDIDELKLLRCAMNLVINAVQRLTTLASKTNQIELKIRVDTTDTNSKDSNSNNTSNKSSFLIFECTDNGRELVLTNDDDADDDKKYNSLFRLPQPQHDGKDNAIMNTKNIDNNNLSLCSMATLLDHSIDGSKYGYLKKQSVQDGNDTTRNIFWFSIPFHDDKDCPRIGHIEDNKMDNIVNSDALLLSKQLNRHSIGRNNQNRSDNENRAAYSNPLFAVEEKRKGGSISNNDPGADDCLGKVDNNNIVSHGTPNLFGSATISAATTTINDSGSSSSLGKISTSSKPLWEMHSSTTSGDYSSGMDNKKRLPISSPMKFLQRQQGEKKNDDNVGRNDDSEDMKRSSALPTTLLPPSSNNNYNIMNNNPEKHDTECQQTNKVADSVVPVYSSVSSSSKTTEVRQRKALVIEDTVVVRKTLARALTKLGYVEVVQANDGMEGLNEMKKQLFDIVLCDFLMPVMDGLDCVKQYREWERVYRPHHQQYIVGISAHANEHDSTAEQGIQAGMNDFRSKPITIKTLTELQESELCIASSDHLDELERMEHQDTSIPSSSSTTPMITKQASTGKVTAPGLDQLLMDIVPSKLLSSSSISNRNDDKSTGQETEERENEAKRCKTKRSPACLIATDRPSLQSNALVDSFIYAGWNVIVVFDGLEVLRLLKMKNWDAVFIYDDIANEPETQSSCIPSFRSWELQNRVTIQKNIFLLNCNSNKGESSSPLPTPPYGYNEVFSKPIPWNDIQSRLLGQQQ